jgi:hypothetical protein
MESPARSLDYTWKPADIQPLNNGARDRLSRKYLILNYRLATIRFVKVNPNDNYLLPR